jgi:hypothetical protein
VPAAPASIPGARPAGEPGNRAPVLAGRWTFQLVEEYDDGYYALFKEVERTAREELVGGRRHLFEAELKQRRRTVGEPGHAATP